MIESSQSGLEATNEPRASQRENKPDYLVRKNGIVIGYIEAKDLDAQLKSVLKSAQIKRYQEALPNLLVTNYLDFVWLVGPDRRMEISLGSLRGKTTVGGYQVCEKWLKDRKGRTLTLDDVEHYCRVVAALGATRTLMAQIDAAAYGVLWSEVPQTEALACT